MMARGAGGSTLLGRNESPTPRVSGEMDASANPDLADADLHPGPDPAVGIAEPPAARKSRWQRNAKDTAVAVGVVGGVVLWKVGRELAEARLRRAIRHKAFDLAWALAKRRVERRLAAFPF